MSDMIHSKTPWQGGVAKDGSVKLLDAEGELVATLKGPKAQLDAVYILKAVNRWKHISFRETARRTGRG